MKKAIFKKLLEIPHTSYWVDNYNGARSIRLVFDIPEGEAYPEAIIEAIDAQDADDIGNDSTFITVGWDDVRVDVSKQYEKAFNLGWTGMNN